MEKDFNNKISETNISTKIPTTKALILTIIGVIFFVFSRLKSLAEGPLLVSGGISNFLLSLLLLVIGTIFFIIGITMFFSIFRKYLKRKYF